MKFNKRLFSCSALITLLSVAWLVTAAVTFVPVQGQEDQVVIDDYIYSSFIGGSNEDRVSDVVEDSQGNVIVTGQTLSTDFSVKNAYQDTFAGGDSDIHSVSGDTIVAKFDPSGKLLWSTFFGGSNRDGGLFARVDGSDNIYITGKTNSEDFPVTADAYQPSFNGGNYDIFMAKFAPDGSLLYSSYFGTVGDEGPSGCVFDPAGNLVIAGGTFSAAFPVTADADQPVSGGAAEGFITRLSANLTSILYSTYLGGSSADGIGAIAIDAQGNTVVTGYTLSDDFPVTADGFQTSITGSQRDFFIAKYDPDNDLIYATYFGGSNIEDCFGTAVDQSGNIIMAGRTSSPDFPVASAYQEEYSGAEVDGFITKLSNDGQRLIFSSYFGGTGWDTIHHVDVDSWGNTAASGIGGSNGFPIRHAFQENNSGSIDVIMMLVSPEGQPLLCSYLGGSGEDHPWNQYLSEDFLYICGFTNSTDFLITDDAYQQSHRGDYDGFIFRFDIKGYLEAAGVNISTKSQANSPGFEIFAFNAGFIALLLEKRIRKKKEMN